ncbi:AAA family ATPase [Acutalibacter caecimuris]|uniref:AAA family ATPase n=1 Tax=Acutalibacter caecimuris TaxID=3093657 RepID=UPI002AC8BB4F|nr:AAA family ATPase [Acutalibacter sp. M00118]
MNPVLQNKLEALERARDYECWYLVKQPTAFDNICYLVSFLKEFQEERRGENLQGFIGKKVGEINRSKPDVEISNNYRALRVAAFFGLITMTSATYEEAVITETFEEAYGRCGGEFEKKGLYEDIIQRQIEKMYISSAVDEGHAGVRQKYRLYPVMLLYKILLELGRATGHYAISMAEYRYLVATTEVFADFLETLLLIRLLREEPDANAAFEQYRTKFDNRLIQALKQLPTLIIDRDSIKLHPDAIPEVARKVFAFESNPDIFVTGDYLGFLASKKSLFELEEFERGEAGGTGTGQDESPAEVGLDQAPRKGNGTNVLLYGVPGAGKSWTIEHEYCRKGAHVERLVFHPDYTYSDFIGQILPKVSPNGQVSYAFTAGPFTNILKEAYTHPQEEYILVIEEINRGNAPAIFGEVFQLLDRKTEDGGTDDDGYPAGTSEYGITHAGMAWEVYRDETHKVRIPSNLSIIGTMNTSDQNVFTLDTAFQRRWDMHLIENSFAHVDRKLAQAAILDTGITWQVFCTEMNKIILGNHVRMASAEDKRLGVHFVQLRDLQFDPGMGNLSHGAYEALCENERAGALNPVEEGMIAGIRKAMKQNRRFPEKVIKYLWDDAFKFDREAVFETDAYQSLEQVIRAFMYAEGIERFAVFKEDIRDALINPKG